MKNEFESNPKIEKEISLEEIASKYYVDIPYHNFDHIKHVLKYAEDAMDQYEKEGVVINKDVVRKALLFHDAGYHGNKSKEFKTKEDYSASIAKIELKKTGYPDEFINKVKEAIVATIKDEEFSTDEQKIVRMSDICNMTEEYEIFLNNNILLKNEIKYMHNKKLSWSEWKKATKDIMEFYMNQDDKMAITKNREENGKTSFHNGIKRNLERFLKEDENYLEKMQKKFEEDFYSKDKPRHETVALEVA